jgi:colicin import membrane protein/protein TonB
VTDVAPSALSHPRDRLWPAVVASVALHAGLLGLATVASLAQRTPPLDPSQRPITARLVRLGTPRPPELLPRKEAPPAPAAETPAPAPVAAPEPAAPRAVALPSAKATARPPAPKAPALPGHEKAGAPAGPRLSSVLSELRHELQAGSPEGDPLGDASEAEGDQYQAQVIRALRQNYRLPATLSDAERISLTATVVVHVEADGRISRYEFEQRSSNPSFDDALERAVRDTRLPAPPADQREALRRSGLRVVFKI